MKEKKKKTKFMPKFELFKIYISFIVLDLCQIYNDI